MTDYLVAYTGPRGGQAKYAPIKADSPREAAEKFIQTTEKTYVEQVYTPVEWRD